MKLPHKLTGIAFAAYMAGIIAFVVSAALTLINTGLSGVQRTAGTTRSTRPWALSVSK